MHQPIGKSIGGQTVKRRHNTGTLTDIRYIKGIFSRAVSHMDIAQQALIAVVEYLRMHSPAGEKGTINGVHQLKNAIQQNHPHRRACRQVVIFAGYFRNPAKISGGYMIVGLHFGRRIGNSAIFDSPNIEIFGAVATGNQFCRCCRIADYRDGIPEAGRGIGILQQYGRRTGKSIPMVHLKGAIHKNHIAHQGVRTGHGNIREHKSTAAYPGKV